MTHLIWFVACSVFFDSCDYSAGVIIVALSYVVNVWLTYYICCKAKRSKKRHLPAVQQKRIESQGEMKNPGLEHDGDEQQSKLVSQAKPVSQEKMISDTAECRNVRASMR